MTFGCAVPGCERTIRGQCPGYKGENCLRYYCEEHSYEGLCAVHGVIKKEDELEKEYAEKFEAEARIVESRVRGQMIVPALAAMAVSLGSCFLFFMILSTIEDTLSGETYSVVFIFLLVGWIALTLSLTAWGWRRRTGLEKFEAAKREGELPNFTELYMKRRKEKMVSEALMGLAIGAVVTGALGAAAQSIIDDEQSSRRRNQDDSDDD